LQASWGQILWTEPLILQLWPSVGFPVGFAAPSARLLVKAPTYFLLNPSWSFETDGRRYHLDAIRAHQATYPLHQFRFVANTDKEAALMTADGVTSVTVNQNCLMNERIFRPLPEIAPVYDAVYNARLSPEKRVELVNELDSVALLYFYALFEFSVEQFHAEHARLRALLPRADFLNPLTEQGCEYFDPRKVNEHLARARVGLCLSPIEGAMRASIEYLFAGLSVVSTPSLGGRDRYFDPEYCIIANPDPRSIREAVAALVQRDVPRDYVRAKTLQKVEADRARYIELVESIIACSGQRASFEPRFRSLVYGEGFNVWRSTKDWLQALRSALPSGKVSPFSPKSAHLNS
jgi:glycosyltransferase involved in cell wall biosynthesis